MIREDLELEAMRSTPCASARASGRSKSMFLYRLANRDKVSLSRERGDPCPPKRAAARLAVRLHRSTSRDGASSLSRYALMAGRDARAPCFSSLSRFASRYYSSGRARNKTRRRDFRSGVRGGTRLGLARHVKCKRDRKC